MADFPDPVVPSNSRAEPPQDRGGWQCAAVLALAVLCGIPAGHLGGWEAGLDVFTAVLGVLRPRVGRGGDHG